jgi:DNA-directed RNA polymerase specialized sigma24 family protein
MAHGPEHAPAVAGVVTGLPVEPRTSVERESVPEHWLVDVDGQDRADRLDRLVQDYEWVNDLALAGFEGKQWDFFVDQLARYGIGVIGGWMRRGLIWDRCQAKGMGGLTPLGRPFTQDEIDELTYETVAKALWHFKHDVLMRHKWDYHRGASLRTYFIGQALIRFANIYRRWCGNEARAGRLDLSEDPYLNTIDPRTASVEADALDHVTATAALGTAKDPRVRKAMILSAADLSQAEIAIELEVTEKTVERMLYNERQRQRQRRRRDSA